MKREVPVLDKEDLLRALQQEDASLAPLDYSTDELKSWPHPDRWRHETTGH